MVLAAAPVGDFLVDAREAVAFVLAVRGGVHGRKVAEIVGDGVYLFAVLLLLIGASWWLGFRHVMPSSTVDLTITCSWAFSQLIGV